MLPESAVQRVNEATVVAVGPGSRNREGDLVPIPLSVGDSVLLPEYGGHTVNFEDVDEEHVLFRADDILGVFVVPFVVTSSCAVASCFTAFITCLCCVA